MFAGKKPPEEITDIAKLSELKALILNIIKSVKTEYNIKILKDCFKVSALLKDIKFVKDFLKLLSKISINNIMENKKYKPPIHCDEDLHNIKPWSICFIFSNIVKPVDVKPEIASKYELTKVRLYMLK